VKAYLLAAGYATRMHPLTLDRPKPLLVVAGAPILSHVAWGVLQLEGLSEIVVIANDRFARQFESWAQDLGADVPVRILNDGTTSDDHKLGALGDLAFALDAVPPGEEAWLVAAGDNLLGFELRSLQRVFQDDADRPLLAVRRVVRDGPSRYNEVIVDESGRVERFREKPDDPVSELAAIALYFFPPRVVSKLAAYLDAGGNPDAPGHFIAWLVDQAEVRATRLPGDWFDIGSLEGLAHAREHYRPPDEQKALQGLHRSPG
jgi:glucose-1-phosphate thymidylyltransferase